jgi:hypothetical protein
MTAVRKELKNLAPAAGTETLGIATRARARATFFACPVCKDLWNSRRDRTALAAYGLFPISLRTGGQTATHLVSQGRGPSGAGALGPRRQRFHPHDGSSHDAATRHCRPNLSAAVTSQADVDKVSDYFRTMVLSAGTVDRPLRENEALTLVLAGALEAIAFARSTLRRTRIETLTEKTLKVYVTST